MFGLDKKKGAEESNMIIFILLALVVAGLVIYFSWGFFSKGTSLIDGTDPVVQSALQACKTEMSVNSQAWCSSIKYVPYAKAKQYMTCHNLNERTGKTISVSQEILDNDNCKEAGQLALAKEYCEELGTTSTGDFKEFVNSFECVRKGDSLFFDESPISA